ncbi:hypothetical protein JKF63_04209 [Porcisia hertigi]|uniref:Uncharacterized protein n=1 Tax=Porcisia hertigi TaxID=2761500 RepID=A0A836I2X5_9TRYP|nr:hypothetical protein JKF63_04209 [Porcisia hertigi]
MSAPIFTTGECSFVSPEREEAPFLCPCASSLKSAADSEEEEEGVGAAAECNTATAGLSHGIAFEERVKRIAYRERRRRRRCCNDAGGALQTVRPERRTCTCQRRVMRTEQSTILFTDGGEVKCILCGSAGGEPSHSVQQSTEAPLAPKHHVQHSTTRNIDGDLENASVSALPGGGTDSLIGSPQAPSPTEVTMWVPTQFTTAAGRAICVRERRVLEADSPYWKLLRFDSSREAIVEPLDSSEGDCEPGVGAVCGDAGALPRRPVLSATKSAGQLPSNVAAASSVASSPRLCEDTASTALPLTYTYVDSAWTHPWAQRRRSASCPERIVGSQMYFSACGSAGYSLPPFLGFCAADGSPFYCRRPPASTEGRTRWDS